MKNKNKTKRDFNDTFERTSGFKKVNITRENSRHNIDLCYKYINSASTFKKITNKLNKKIILI
jgi:hypothetical protein